MKRRLGIILKGYPRVSETFIAQEIYLLEQQGFEIEIYSMRGGREPQRQPIIAKIRAPVTYLPEYIWPSLGTIFRQNAKVCARRPLHYLSLLARACTRSLRQRSDDPLKRFLQAGWLVGHRALRPDSNVHLHSHFAHAPTELAWYAAKLSSLKYSISAHAKDIYTVPPAELSRRVRDSEFIMTCTSYNRHFLRALPGVSSDKVHLVYHGLDLQTFKPSARPAWDTARLQRLVSVGRLVEKKGYVDIFAALKILREKHLDFSYDIYGAGEQLDTLMHLRDHLGLEKEIHFHKTAVQPQIVARLQEGGIFLCGSRISGDGDRDGIPNTVAEAMAMKLPVIATDVSGIPELVQDQTNGVLVPERRPDLLARAIENLWAHPERAEDLGEQARIRVQQIFDSHNCIHDCERLLRPFTEVSH